MAFNRQAIEIARRNFSNSFSVAESLAGAKNLAEAVELQTAYWRKQLSELAAQAGDMRALTTMVSADMAAPIKAQVARGMKRLHKPT